MHFYLLDHFFMAFEIMLQQTRVETVIGYFYRFMEQFPTIQDLAAAEEQKLLKVWEGLGYYSRARNLKAAAQQIVAEFDGEMPQSIEEIRSLKGKSNCSCSSFAHVRCRASYCSFVTSTAICIERGGIRWS